MLKSKDCEHSAKASGNWGIRGQQGWDDIAQRRP